MEAVESALEVPGSAWRRVLHDAQLRPGNVKAWLRMIWPKAPQGVEADLVHRLGGLDRRHPGEAGAIARYLEQEQLIERNGNGRYRITATGCARWN